MLATSLLRNRLSASPFVIFTAIGMVSNLVAFALSYNMPAGYTELDTLVQPGLLISLAKTEGIVLLATLVIAVALRHPPERLFFQSLVAGFFAADAVNDVVLFSTGSQLLATEFAWLAAASLPVAAGLLVLRRDRGLRPADEASRAVLG